MGDADKQKPRYMEWYEFVGLLIFWYVIISVFADGKWMVPSSWLDGVFMLFCLAGLSAISCELMMAAGWFHRDLFRPRRSKMP